MSVFETFTCEECGDAYRAHPSSNAAGNGYCSPQCETDGKEL